MIVKLASVAKYFGRVKAVDDIAFSVQKGEVVGFVGANGAGKTTTIQLLLGTLRATEGDILLFGHRITPYAAHKTHGKIGYAAGDMALPARLTGKQYFAFVASQMPGEHQPRLRELVALFDPPLTQKIGTLSRGNKQKIALIAAFMARPDLVVLDEPTSGLDPLMQEVFLQLVRDEQARGTTVFMSSHYLAEVVDVCSRVIVMKHGRIVMDVPKAELVERGGKQVHITTGYGRTVAPRGAEAVEKSTEAGVTRLSFTWKHEPAKLQQWLAGVKQLRDIEVSEFNLESALDELYTDEEVAA